MGPEMGKIRPKMGLSAKIRETTYPKKVAVSLLLCPAGFACGAPPLRSGFEFYLNYRILLSDKYFIYLFATIRSGDHDQVVAGGISAHRQRNGCSTGVGYRLFDQGLTGQVHEADVGAHRCIAAQGDVDVIRSRVRVDADCADRPDPNGLHG